MSLDKAVKHGKEHRKPYYRAAAIDKSCRPHGGCEWCLGNRMHKHRRNLPAPNGKGFVNYGVFDGYYEEINKSNEATYSQEYDFYQRR